MTQPANAMEIFTQLDKSNCRECGEKTCLAFAAAVFQSRKQISQCSKVDRATIERFEIHEVTTGQSEVGDQIMDGLKKAVSEIDPIETAKLIEGEYDGQKMSVRMLGKRCGINAEGRLITDIHVNAYVVAPLIEYMLYSKGLDPTGEWVSFRELKAGRSFSYALNLPSCLRRYHSITELNNRLKIEYGSGIKEYENADI